jgi:cytochrome P450
MDRDLQDCDDFRPAISETGIPHSLIKDDTFDGYKIAAGTVVTYNHWAISHLDYKDPERFYPERFLDDDLDVPTKGHLGFGAGKPHSFPCLLLRIRILTAQ